LTGFANLSAQEVVVTHFHTTDPIQPAVSDCLYPAAFKIISLSHAGFSACRDG